MSVEDYLLFVEMNKDGKNVDLNLRLAGEPEETAEINSLSVEEFRKIFVDIFRTPPDKFEEGVKKLQYGFGFTINLMMSRESIEKSGLLTRNVTNSRTKRD